MSLLAARIDFSSGISAKKARLGPLSSPAADISTSSIPSCRIFIISAAVGDRAGAKPSIPFLVRGNAPGFAVEASRNGRPLFFKLSLFLSLSRRDPVFVTRFLMRAIVPWYHHRSGNDDAVCWSQCPTMNGINPLLVDLHAPFLRPVLSDDVSSSKYSFLERSINYESYVMDDRNFNYNVCMRVLLFTKRDFLVFDGRKRRGGSLKRKARIFTSRSLRRVQRKIARFRRRLEDESFRVLREIPSLLL